MWFYVKKEEEKKVIFVGACRIIKCYDQITPTLVIFFNPMFNTSLRNQNMHTSI